MSQHRTEPRRDTGFVSLVIVFGLLTSACSPDGGEKARMEADSAAGYTEVIPAGQPRAGLEMPAAGAASSRMTNVDEPVGQPPPRPSAREGSASLRGRLTPQYLQGEWCGVYSQERMWYVFASDGSYQAGMGHLPDVEGTIDALVEDLRVIIEVEADRFVLARGERQSYRLVMSRGACRAASAPAEERAPRAPGSR